MCYWSDDEKRALYYSNRKRRLDKEFAWTEEAVQNLRRLNEGLARMQDRLAAEIREVHGIFSRLEKGGMSFLRGSKVVGWCRFEKAVISEYDKLEKMTEAQRKTYCRWDEIAFCSSDELNAWQLVFDSETGDFMPLSKVRLREKRCAWSLDFPEDEADLVCCSCLAHLIENNRSFSKKDLAECTAEDFYPCIAVMLNYPASELYEFSADSRHTPYAAPELVRDMLESRRRALNETFEWNERNIQKMMDVNGWLWKRTVEMKRYMTALAAALQETAQENARFRDYSIAGHIEYHGTEANDIATLEIQKALSSFAAFHFYSVRCDADFPEARDSIHANESLNWNVEVYRHHFSEEQLKVRFHYFMHTVFVDDCVYSFEDLVRMREEDLKLCLEIDLPLD